MGRVLATAIVLAHPLTGQVEAFLPGQGVPEWVADLVTNEAVWATEPGEGETPTPDDPDDSAGTDHEGDAPKPDDDNTPADGGSGEGETPTHPPTSGPGSSREAWATYADELGVEIDPSWTREQIRDAIDGNNDN